MKKILFVSLLFISTMLFAQTSVNSDAKIVEKEISGFVTHSRKSLANVNVVIKYAAHRGVKTNEKGFYSIKANVGEIIRFTYVGMKTIEIVVEDITKVLNINMKTYDNTLDEVTISVKKGKRIDFTPIKKSRTIKTSKGIIDTRKAGYGVSYIPGDELNLSSASLAKALVGRVAGYKLVTNRFREEYVSLRSTGSFTSRKFAIWDLDGVIFKRIPPINLSDIKDVTILKSLAAVNQYGSEGAGGVIVVRTITGTFEKSKDIYSKSNPYTNKEYYEEDAMPIRNLRYKQPSYLDTFDSITSVVDAYSTYKNLSKKYKNNSDFYMTVSDYFLKTYNDSSKSEAILADLETVAASNPETLKAIAFTYQERHLYKKALVVYKEIMKLRPSYAQSLRDLANAYVDVNDYPFAWKIYLIVRLSTTYCNASYY